MMPLLHQATGVLVDGLVVLIEGEPGSGKTSLALALIDRGAVLVGDDGVVLEARDGGLWAGPPSATAGLIEIRNVGLATMPCTWGPVGLVLRLDHAAPRFVEQADCVTLAGMEIPLLHLCPDTAALPLRAEWAVRLHAIRP
jgi:hypothetical protein